MKPFSFLTMLSIAVLVLMSSGCATLVSKKQYAVTIDNHPGPTCFSVYNRQNELVSQGVTPQQITLDAKSAPFVPAKYSVVIAGEASTTQTQTVKASFDPWTLGNIVIGGGLGAIVDGASGAMFALPPKVSGNVSSQYAVTDSARGSQLASAAMAGPNNPSLQNQMPAAWTDDGNQSLAATKQPDRAMPASGPTSTQVLPASAISNIR